MTAQDRTAATKRRPTEAEIARDDWDTYLPPDVGCTCGGMGAGLHYPDCAVARFRHWQWVAH